jgi:Cdc6-like AAA superfamily ATPase
MTYTLIEDDLKEIKEIISKSINTKSLKSLIISEKIILKQNIAYKI